MTGGTLGVRAARRRWLRSAGAAGTAALAALVLAGGSAAAATAAAPHWTLVSTPDSSTTADNELSGVSCPNTSFCMAVGYYGNGTADQTLTLRWNGTKWAKVSSPDVGTTENYLNELSCTSATYCLAAGWYRPVSHALTEKW